MPLNDGIEIVGFVGALLGAKHQNLNHVSDDDLQMLPILFIQSEQEGGQHGEDHQHGGRGISQRFLGCKIQGDANEQTEAETDQLPLGQVEKNLAFDLGKVFGDGYIGHFLTSLVGIEYGAGKAAGFEQAEAEQHCVAHAGPDGVADLPGYGDVLHQHGVDRHADHNEKCLKAQSE